jgi:DNA-binding HxlR family transcriptional regulator
MSSPNGFGQYCPITRAVEVLGERWSLLILRDMLVGATRFNDLARGNPGLSRSLLTKRLRQLERAGILERLDGEYLLTDAGRDLKPLVFGLGEWGAKWVFDEPRADELDAQLLVWWMHTRIDAEELPDRRTVLHLRFDDDPRLFWLVIEHGTASVCLSDPGFAIDVTITGDCATFYKVWLGQQPIKGALKNGTLRAEGQAAITRRVVAALQLSPIAEVVRTAQG